MDGGKEGGWEGDAGLDAEPEEEEEGGWVDGRVQGWEDVLEEGGKDRGRGGGGREELRVVVQVGDERFCWGR